jgi:hypothetical protein
MRIHESMKELLEKCLDKDRPDIVLLAWDRFFIRVTIYLTRVLLEMRVSANQATGLGLLSVLIGGALIAFPQPLFWYIGLFFIASWEVFDFVDGQIARYNKTSSMKGAWWAGICHHIIEPWIIIGASIGLWQSLNNFLPIASGFIGLLGHTLTISNQLLPFIVIYERKLSYDAFKPVSNTSGKNTENAFIRFGRLVFRFEAIIIAFLVTTIIDSFVSPFTVGGMLINLRYIYYSLYTLALFGNAVRRIYLSFRGEFRLDM